ncbi:hypothetical protein M378DRAFT_170573 [Amanita muscaria Koide BX008]|uniref:Uncharacterized protein n=1 Tax=Amanita muscaria (strain Koide BX008) TaxID=946122 RepID=A0A0C2WP56_AMAMK|nr:hypothetical protein M378DRAFT_170573 [Amanita muscaria Koide BX008]
MPHGTYSSGPTLGREFKITSLYRIFIFRACVLAIYHLAGTRDMTYAAVVLARFVPS